MKKIMIAAVAATMTSVSMADISITGDAYFSYADQAIGMGAMSKTANTKRVNINVKGQSGNTTVVASARGDDQKADTRTSKLSLHQFYVTTKAGPIDIKAGDFYGTIGLGAFSKSEKKTDALVLSTNIGPTKLGIYTNDSSKMSSSTNIFASTKIAGAKVKVHHNPDSDTGWTNFMAKGTFGGILVAAENHAAKNDKDVTLVHIGGKVGSVSWDVAQVKNDMSHTGLSNSYTTKVNDDGDMIVTATGTNNNSKFAPLGSMLIGKGARGGTATAAANIGQLSKILGVAISTKLAGNTVKAIFSKATMFSKADMYNDNTMNAMSEKVTGTELILTRPLSGGKLTVNLGKLSGADNKALNDTNKGLRFDVKF